MQASDKNGCGRVVPIGRDDIPAIHALQCRAFKPEFHEPVELYYEMFAFYPDGCFAIMVDDTMAGYVFLHPADDDRTDYEAAGWAQRGDEQCLFIHDLCIDPDFQGQGLSLIGARHVETVTRERGFQKIIGVAIEGVQEFWEKQGFTMVRPYRYNGEPAMFMEKVIG